MTEPVIINKFGKLTGWNDMKFAPLGKVLYGVTEVEYKDDTEADFEHGDGNLPIGYAEGNTKATCSIVIYVEEVFALENSLKPGQRLQDIDFFDFPVIYDLKGVIRKDIIHNCKFVGNGRAWKQNEGKSTMKFDLKTSHITYNKR